MKKEKIFRRSKELKKQGEIILKESRLLDFLSKYGKVTLTGSFKMDLMMHGDIDMYVVLPDLRNEAVIEIFNDLIKQEYFHGFYYGDYIKNPKKGMPSGYYIGLNMIRDEIFWKIDIWFLKELDKEKMRFEKEVEKRMTEESKYEILKMKKERNENEPRYIGGYEMYKKILNI